LLSRVPNVRVKSDDRTNSGLQVRYWIFVLNSATSVRNAHLLMWMKHRNRENRKSVAAHLQYR